MKYLLKGSSGACGAMPAIPEVVWSDTSGDCIANPLMPAERRLTGDHQSRVMDKAPGACGAMPAIPEVV
jgi:hypothetical protein